MKKPVIRYGWPDFFANMRKTQLPYDILYVAVALYKSIYERLLELEKDGEIVREPGKKGLGYLHELLMNDGPEFCYTIVFWHKNESARKYKIGVCIRGLPICKPYE